MCRSFALCRHVGRRRDENQIFRGGTSGIEKPRIRAGRAAKCGGAAGTSKAGNWALMPGSILFCAC